MRVEASSGSGGGGGGNLDFSQMECIKNGTYSSSQTYTFNTTLTPDTVYFVVNRHSRAGAFTEGQKYDFQNNTISTDWDNFIYLDMILKVDSSNNVIKLFEPMADSMITTATYSGTSLVLASSMFPSGNAAMAIFKMD